MCKLNWIWSAKSANHTNVLLWCQCCKEHTWYLYLYVQQQWRSTWSFHSGIPQKLILPLSTPHHHLTHTIIYLAPSSPILSHLILHSILLFYSRIKWEMMLLTLVLSRRQWRFLASLYKAWYIPVVHIYLYIGSIPVFHIGFEKHYR